jgi:hypothetical protein
MKVEHQNLPDDTNPSVQAEAHVFDNGIHHLILHNLDRQGYVALGRDELVTLVKFLTEQDFGLVMHQLRVIAMTPTERY